tara:strand:+ start:2188 stop:2487 length:300 start_codon:yes stop_codon:yes gene_type:complete
MKNKKPGTGPAVPAEPSGRNRKIDPPSLEAMRAEIRSKLQHTGLQESIDSVYQILAGGNADVTAAASEILGYALWALELGISTSVEEAIAAGKNENGIT